jgi:hypothetical protein
LVTSIIHMTKKYNSMNSEKEEATIVAEKNAKERAL